MTKIIKKTPPSKFSPSFENKKSPSIENKNSPASKFLKHKEVKIDGFQFPELSSNKNYNKPKEEEWVEIKEKRKEQRNKAFDILSDKNKIENKLNRTKMCFSVSKGIVCPHKNCRFAHNKEQLVIANCLFRDCRFVKKDEKNFFTNVSKTKICNYKHHNETLDNYYKRVQINETPNIRKL